MRIERRDVRLALLVVLIACVVLLAGRLLGGPADRGAECERIVGSGRGSTDADVERVCSRLR